MKLKWHKQTENARLFWAQLAAIAAVIWLAAGLISFLKMPSVLSLAVSMAVGLAPCALFLFAVLSMLETKRKRPPLKKAQQKTENIIFVLFGLLAFMAEFVHQLTDTISYALPLMAAALAVSGIIRIVGPQVGDEKKRRTTLQSRFPPKDMILIMLLGMAACIIFGRFFAVTVDVVVALANK